MRHLLGKDILKFHCVIWPALLLAAGLEVPRQLFVHGYLLLDERKMSKSLGNVIDPLDLVDVYGVDPLRFYLFRVATFGQDGSISIDGLHERYERELGNDLGNLLSRTTAMIARYRDGGSVRSRCPTSWRRRSTAARDGGRGAARRVRPHRRARAGLGARAPLNRHVEQTAPWELAKDEPRADELDRVLYELADGLRAVAVALAAFVPETAERILAASASRRTSPGTGWRPGGRSRPTGSSRRRRSSRGWTRRRRPREARGASRRAMIDTHAHLDAFEDAGDGPRAGAGGGGRRA